MCSYIFCQIQCSPVTMSKPSIPKSPTSRPPPLITTSSKILNRSKSEQKLGKGEMSPEKRVRLRDYLFIASASSQRNSEKKQDLKNSIIQKDALKSSISQLKRKKYGLPNHEMYGIVKAEITKEIGSLIEELQVKLAALNSEVVPNPTNEDLHYLYDIKHVVIDSIRPALREMDELTFSKNSYVIKEIFNMALNNPPIKEENQEDSRYVEKAPPTDSLQFLQALFGGKGIIS